MSDYPSSLRPPPQSSAAQSHSHHSMGSAPIGRAASPIGNSNPGGAGGTGAGAGAGRYSLGGGSSADSAKRNAGAGLRSPGQASMNLTSAPPANRFGGPRPSSEMIGAMHHHHGAAGHHYSHQQQQQQQQGGGRNTSDPEAMDKWFEDLQHYEATLEEMAAASLDQNFKEELSAIEQWFRVLSEAERTAALYSLLQESTQVQIRFFITVLQQMARSDPSSAFLGQGINNPMAEQMEAKLASLGLKSPSAAKSPASPNNRGSTSYLSPNHASMNFSPQVGSDAAATLAAQRAKLKANRVSAPGTFTGDQRSFSGSTGSGATGLDQVQEQRASSPSGFDNTRSPGLDGSGMRPKSIDALSKAAAAGTGGNATGPPRSPRRSGPLDTELSPIVNTGSWASMVNTPLTNLFDDGSSGPNGQANVNLDQAASQLASVAEAGGNAGGNAAAGAGSHSNNSAVMLDPDVSKYQRRKSGGPERDSSGASPNLGAAWGPPGASSNDFLRQAMAPSPNAANSNAQFANFPTMSPNSFAGLQSPSGGFGNGLNMQMMNAMAAMGGLNNANAAQFLAMQQQILQNQQQIAAMAAAAQQGGGQHQQQQQRRHQNLSPPSQQAHLAQSGRRSPAPGGRPSLGPGGAGGIAAASTSTSGLRAGASSSGGGGASNADEEVPDMSILSDTPAWLRHLRLHKYTPNFETSSWREMVVMSDGDLEAKGVAALGARRKLLKTFRAVREKHGIKGKDDVEKPGDGLGALPGSANAPGTEGGTASAAAPAAGATTTGEAAAAAE